VTATLTPLAPASRTASLKACVMTSG